MASSTTDKNVNVKIGRKVQTITIKVDSSSDKKDTTADYIITLLVLGLFGAAYLGYIVIPW